MEALMLFLDAIAILILVYGALIDDKRPRNAPQRSLFRYIQDEVDGGPPVKPKPVSRFVRR